MCQRLFLKIILRAKNVGWQIPNDVKKINERRQLRQKNIRSNEWSGNLWNENCIVDENVKQTSLSNFAIDRKAGKQQVDVIIVDILDGVTFRGAI